MTEASRPGSPPFWAVWRERIVYLLLFLLPVAGISVRHWISTTFALLFLLSLPDVFRRPRDLLAPERRLMVIAAVFFAAFVVTAVANGWTDVQTRYLGKEIRFLLLIPIYLTVRRYPDAGLWLLRGGVAGGLALLAQALYDVHVLGLPRAQGIYSPNLLGPVAALTAVLLLVLWRVERPRVWVRVLIACSACAALVALSLSVSRGAYLGLLGMLFVWGALRFRGRRYATMIAGIAALAVLGYTVSDHVRRGIDAAALQVARAVEAGDVTVQPGSLESVPARFEMWRVSVLIFREHPLLGVGRGNYTAAARTFAQRGAVHEEVANHGHPHNAYLEMMVSKGVFGLAAFLALLLYPLALFLKTRDRAPGSSTAGVVFIVGFMLFSLTDASPFIKGNYASLFIIYLVVLFSWHLRESAGGGR